MQWGAGATLALLLACPLLAAAHVGEHYVDARDREIAELATGAAVSRCQAGFQGRRQAFGRERLEMLVGEDNIVLEAMRDASSRADAAQRLAQHSHAPWLALQSLPLLFGLVLFFLYWCVCWSLCPWSRCFPCRPKEGQFSRCCKCCLSVIFILWIAQIVVAAFFTNTAYSLVVTGFDNSFCSAAQILDVTLSGQAESPQFIGMVPLLERLQRLAEDFEDDSTLVANLTRLLDASAEIADAMQVATATLDLLESAVSLPENVRPGSTMNRNLMHTSTLGDSLAAPLAQARASLADGRAGALFAARDSVTIRLSNVSRASARSTLRSALSSMAEFKRGVRDVMAFSLEPGRFQTLREQVDGNLWYVAHLFLPHSALIWLLSLMSVLLVSRRSSCHALGAELAWCSWECGCCFLLPAFIIGGFLLALAPPFAGACLIAEDLNSDMLRDISAGIAVNMSADRGVIMGDLADRCFSVPSDSSVSTNLFDIVYGRDGATDGKIYLRDELVVRLGEPLQSAFGDLNATAPGGVLASDAAVTALLAALQESEAEVLLVPDSLQMMADPVLANLSAGDGSLTSGLVASSACSNFTTEGGEVVIGMQSVVDRLLELGTANGNVTMGCLQTVECSAGPDTEERAVCDAGNALVELKAELVDAALAGGGLFRCDVFEAADGSSCDPLDMAQDLRGAWLGDCLRPSRPDGKVLKVMERSCSLGEFAAFVKEFEGRVQAAVERLDAAAAQVEAAVGADLRATVFGEVLDAIGALSRESSCSYMPDLYTDMLEGACHQGISGLVAIGYAYVGSGVMMLLAAFVMYSFWRAHARPKKQQQDQQDDDDNAPADQDGSGEDVVVAAVP